MDSEYERQKGRQADAIARGGPVLQELIGEEPGLMSRMRDAEDGAIGIPRDEQFLVGGDDVNPPRAPQR